jgi:hypothetical protein
MLTSLGVGITGPPSFDLLWSLTLDDILVRQAVVGSCLLAVAVAGPALVVSEPRRELAVGQKGLRLAFVRIRQTEHGY